MLCRNEIEYVRIGTTTGAPMDAILDGLPLNSSLTLPFTVSIRSATSIHLSQIGGYPMNTNAKLVEHLYGSLDRHDADAMARCYHQTATFHDIAFDLRGKNQIASMWKMICDSDIKATFAIIDSSADQVTVKLIDEYTFSETGRRVCNVIESRLRFSGELIVEHVDACDSRLWAGMALGGISGFIAGRVGLLRRLMAARKLRKYQLTNQT
jgi:SnoaL-like domain